MIRQLTTLSMLALFAGCTLQGAGSATPVLDGSRNSEILAPDLYPNGVKPDEGANARYGRYTLVNTAPDVEQRDLMSQIIDVNIPSNMHPQVQDAMQYVVDRSGYSLCPASTDHVNILYTRPLPAAQYKLGPMSLRNTLQVLAGPAWLVKVDEVSRSVCFTLRPGYQAPAVPTNNKPLPAPISNSAQTFAASTSGQAVVAIPTAVAPAAPIVTSTPTPVAKTVPSTPVDPAKEGPHLPPININPTPSAGLGNPIGSTSTATALANTSATPVKPVVSAAQTPVIPAPETPLHIPTPAAMSQVPISVKPAPSVQLWTVTVEDGNLRHTLKRWTNKAGWTFDETEHWVSPVDIPITANATFPGDIKDAVRGLIGTTELSDTPLHPCFYENNVIRVVNFNVTCDAANAR